MSHKKHTINLIKHSYTVFFTSARTQTHTHTQCAHPHMHIHRERERERERVQISIHYMDQQKAVHQLFSNIYPIKNSPVQLPDLYLHRGGAALLNQQQRTLKQLLFTATFIAPCIPKQHLKLRYTKAHNHVLQHKNTPTILHWAHIAHNRCVLYECTSYLHIHEVMNQYNSPASIKAFKSLVVQR